MPAPGRDLGDVALLPGLVNAHTHLEFSDCPRPIGHRGMPLEQWIRHVIQTRAGTTAESKQNAVAAGFRESQDAGVQLIGEITTTPCEYPSNGDSPELVTFAEVLGLSSSRAEERLDSAMTHNETYANAGWSPHAPYSTSFGIVERCVMLARQYGRPVAMHVAESPAERELLRSGSGPFAETLRELGVWQDRLFPWCDDPYGQLIECLSHAPQALLVHANDLRESEIARLAEHRRMSVVYCPRTHDYFGYPPHPVRLMLDAGLRVALGTDSRASNPDLMLWKEVQFLLNRRADLDPATVIKMATLNGADALGRADLGRIEVAAQPSFGYVETEAQSLTQLYADFAGRTFRRVQR